jgi:O-antigen ligase
LFEHYRIEALVYPKYILNPSIAGVTVNWGGRSMGVFLQPSATGMAMVSAFLLSLYSLSKMKGAMARILSWFLTGITPVAIFFSYTRSVYLGFALSMLTLVIFSRKLRIYALVIIVAIGLGVMGNWENVTTEDRAAGGVATKATALGRLTLLQASWLMFIDRPLFGVGFQNFKKHSDHYVRQVRTTLLGYREASVGKGASQHNHLLNVLTETGLMGAVPLILVWIFVLTALIRARTVPTGLYDSDFVVVVMAIFAEYLTAAQFMEPRHFEFMNTLPYLLAGIVVGGYLRATLPGLNGGMAGERSVPGEGPVRRP